jgi:cytochrome oxidase Cu insertion factor (SCO1/SenC/PrrC family)
VTIRIIVLTTLAIATGLRADVVNVAPERGHAVSNIRWTDQTGRTRELSEFAGYPVILLPIYTRCRGACVQSISRLKEAMVKSSADPAQFRVLLFSFDATDTPAILAAYREREQIPLSWSVGSSTQADICWDRSACRWAKPAGNSPILISSFFSMAGCA